MILCIFQWIIDYKKWRLDGYVRNKVLVLVLGMKRLTPVAGIYSGNAIARAPDAGAVYTPPRVYGTSCPK